MLEPLAIVRYVKQRAFTAAYLDTIQVNFSYLLRIRFPPPYLRIHVEPIPIPS
jgi:hypothetical protein